MAQNGLDNFIMGFTHSLEVNSEEIVDVLTLLSKKELTKGDKNNNSRRSSFGKRRNLHHARQKAL